jgi:hypothetical protein
MGVGVMRDKTLKRRDLNVSHTLGSTRIKNSNPNDGSSGHVDRDPDSVPEKSHELVCIR